MNQKLKKILSGMGLLAAFGLGGSAIAGAQNDKPSTKPAASQTETGEHNDGAETDQVVTGADANRAGQAALQEVGGGKVVSVDKETPDQGADTPEPGDKADSAAEQALDQNTAYSVEVQKSDGTTVDVSLDSTFKVLASEQDHEDNGGAEQADGGVEQPDGGADQADAGQR